MEQAKIASALKKAIERNELSIVYQPIFHLKTFEMESMEALIRWHHPEFGIIAPHYFIPIAEKTDLIHPLGLWIFNTVCLQLKDWINAGYLNVNIAINVSPRQLSKINFFEKIQQIMQDLDIPPRLLVLELTETSLLPFNQQSIKLLEAIRDFGICIAIDDFGTGYSSISHLKNLPIKSIKLDQTFVQDIHKDPKNAVIVHTLIELGLKLNLKVIAEGIETQEQLNYLIENDCTYGQGFFLSKSLSGDEMTHLLKTKKNNHD